MVGMLTKSPTLVILYIYEHVFNGWLMCQPFFYSIDMFLSILILGFGLTGLEVRRGFGVFIVIGVAFGVFFFFFGFLVGFGVGFGVGLIVAVLRSITWFRFYS